MAIAYQEQAQLSCPVCQRDFEAPIWLILDAQEQPEAVEALRRDELNLVACPHCGNSGPAGSPLLFHDGAARRVIFAPAPGAEEHEIRDQARELHALLVGSIPEDQRRPYLADVDIAQDLAGVAHLLQRMDRRRQARPSSGQPSMPAPTVPDGSEPARPVEATPPLLLAVEAMLAADSPEELDRALAAHPILLDPSTDATLAQLAQVATDQRAFEIAESLASARAILVRMAPVQGNAAGPAAAALTGIPEPTLQALLQTASSQELAAVVAIHPLLLRPEADRLLAERVNLALDEGNERAAQAIEERREALAELRAAQAMAARREAAAPPPTDEPTLDEAIEALLISEGEDDIAAVIDRYPVLLDEVAAQALWQFAAEARASGDEELARYAVECRELLNRVRERLNS